MDIIPPLNNLQNLSLSVEKIVEGVIENLPEVLRDALTSGSLSLKADINSQGVFLNKLNVLLKLPTAEGQIKEIPLELNLRNAVLDLPSSGREAIVRLQSSGLSTATVKFLGIDNMPVESFLSPNTSKPVTVDSSEALIVKNPADFKQIPLQPVDVKPWVANIIDKSPLPVNLKSNILEVLKPTNLTIEIVDIQPTSLPKGTVEIIPVLTDKITEVLTKFNGDTTPETIKVLSETLAKELGNLNRMVLSGKVVSEAGISHIKTPLGNIFPEKPLKITEGTEVLLQVRNMPEISLSENVSSRLPELKSLNDFMDILKPLQQTSDKSLLTEIVAKLPSLTPKMLPNLVSFIKGAVSHQLNDWVGPEITERLGKLGAEGQETISKLNNILIGNSREGVGWRIIEVPFFDGQNLGKIKVSVKKNTEEEKSSDKKKKSTAGTRFVVDTNFSRLGSFQFDGFAVARTRRFDLIVRTDRSIDDDLYANLLRIFKNTLYELEYSGNIKINVKENFIKIWENTTQSEILNDGIYI